MEICYGWEELWGNWGGVYEYFVVDCEESDLSGWYVDVDIGLELWLGCCGVGGESGDGFGGNVDYEFDVCVGEGLYDGWVGVVDFDVVESGSEE